MDPTDLHAALQTVIGFPVTPFSDDGDLDLAPFRNNIDFMVSGGIRTIVVAGGTGELYSLTPQECTSLYQTAVECVGDRATVIAGVGFSVATACDLARHAERLGCAGVMMFPAYYGASEQGGFYEYYRTIAASTALGCLPYARDRAVLSPELVSRLADIDNIVAYKDGHGDLRSWNAIRQRIGDRLVFLSGAGDDLSVPYLASGARGFTSSVANYDAGTPLQVFELCQRGHFGEADELLRKAGVLDTYALRQRRRGHEVTVTKRAMDLAGLRGGPVRPPLAALSDQEEEELRAIVGTRSTGSAPAAVEKAR